MVIIKRIAFILIVFTNSLLAKEIISLSISLPSGFHKLELLKKERSYIIKTNSNYYNRLLELEGIGELGLNDLSEESIDKLKTIGEKVQKLNKQIKGATIFEGNAAHQIQMSINKTSVSYKNPYHNKALVLLKKIISKSKTNLLSGIKYKDPFIEVYQNKKMTKKDYLNKKKSCTGSENNGTCNFKDFLIMLGK